MIDNAIDESMGTKEKILLIALNLFSNYGYDAVSVREIAKELNISQAALYKHYSSKQDIFDSIIKKMEQTDCARAVAYQMPEGTKEDGCKQYKTAMIDSVYNYTIAQFDYWTQDIFASKFRKMLELEQFKNKKMADLYSQYLTSEPLKYIEEIFVEFCNDKVKARQLAFDFYATFYFLIKLYDNYENKDTLKDLLLAHIEEFNKKIIEEIKLNG